jgi:ATP-dependent RNA helicase RhlE
MKAAANFRDLNIAPQLLSILEKQQLTIPTPIQHQCIPLALEGKDIVGIAQTGTGKTLAFGLPIIQRLLEHQGQALVLMPTRELASQVEEMLQRIGRSLGLKVAVLIGGTSSHEQRRMLSRNPHVVISTPGRLNDHLQQRNYSLCQVKILVLDEADRMLDIGFLPQIKKILEDAPRERQTMMFSATMPGAIAEIAAKYMRLPLRIEVAPTGTAAENVEQEIFIVEREDKMRLLEKFLMDPAFRTVLVFSRTKHFAKKIASMVRVMGHSSAEIHSNRSMSQRKEALDGFKSGKYRVLVATDIASRGIDVKEISLVVNYDLPDDLEDYVHRIGRTGRAGKFGKAISFATPGERYTIRQLERLIRKTIPVLALPALPQRRTAVPVATAAPRDFRQSRRPFARGRNDNSQRRYR